MHSSELLKTIVHQHRQLVPRLSSQTPTDQIEQLDEGTSRSAGDQHGIHWKHGQFEIKKFDFCHTVVMHPNGQGLKI